MSERKRAYRYRVTETGGAGSQAVKNSPFIIDWTYFGRGHTWNIVGGPASGFAPEGFITGTYVDKGWLIDGQYKTDAEVAA